MQDIFLKALGPFENRNFILTETLDWHTKKKNNVHDNIVYLMVHEPYGAFCNFLW